MKFKDFLKEEWLDSFMARTRFTAEIFKNPTPSEYKALTEQDDEIRGIILPNGDLLIWPSTAAEHYDVLRHLGIGSRQHNIPIYIFSLKGWVEISYYTIHDISDWNVYKQIKEIDDKIKDNKYLKRILGTVVLKKA